MLQLEQEHESLHNGDKLAFLKSKSPGKVLGIVCEDKCVWERRCPLAPRHVKQLKEKGVRVLMEPSNRRIYSMKAYMNAGASVQEDISEASVIMGIKQISIKRLHPNKTYCFFSRIMRAQETEMPMLDCILEKNIRLIDYEKMVDTTGKRTVAFGKLAGMAGTITILHGLGLRLLALGYQTPFVNIGAAQCYRNSSVAVQALRDVGYEISLGRMPKEVGPLTFVFTGSGNVSQGAQEIFQELPHKYIEPADLPQVSQHGDTDVVYATVVSRRNYLKRIDGGDFNAEEYENYPQRYYSNFAETIAPYACVIINCIYWPENFPKLVTVTDAVNLASPENAFPNKGIPRLCRPLAVCDISADVGGSIEFTTKFTTIDSPFYVYDAMKNATSTNLAGPGILVCSINNMPTQLAREATDFFGDLLYPYLDNILSSDATKPLEEHQFLTTVENAIIASNGKLTPNFEYIDDIRKSSKIKLASK